MSSLNEKNKDAKYPSSSVRTEIMREILEPETKQFGLDYSNHKAYSYVMNAMHQILGETDKFLSRQYYHRDLAIKALSEGDVPTALDHLHQIGV